MRARLERDRLRWTQFSGVTAGVAFRRVITNPSSLRPLHFLAWRIDQTSVAPRVCVNSVSYIKRNNK